MRSVNDRHGKKKSPIKGELFSVFSDLIDTPKGIRTPVASVKGRCPRPLDDGGEAMFEKRVSEHQSKLRVRRTLRQDTGQIVF